MNNQATTVETKAPEIELVDTDEACRILGGSRPLNRSTLYRGVKDGRYPAPIHIGPASSRWLRSELLATIKALVDAREAVSA